MTRTSEVGHPEIMSVISRQEMQDRSGGHDGIRNRKKHCCAETTSMEGILRWNCIDTVDSVIDRRNRKRELAETRVMHGYDA